MTWLDLPADHPFGVGNLPYGVFSTGGSSPRVGTRIGDHVLDLGDMAAGQGHQVVLWLDDSATSLDLGHAIRLGAAEGQRGRVLLRGERGWFGADVETLRWGRWVVGGVLAAVLLFSAPPTAGSALLPFPFSPYRAASCWEPANR